MQADIAASWFGSAPGLSVTTSSNGDSSAAGPFVLVGDPVDTSYVVTNTGNSQATAVDLVDDANSTVTCPATILDANASMTCVGTRTAAIGAHQSTATATARSVTGDPIGSSAAVAYFGAAPDVSLSESVSLTSVTTSFHLGGNRTGAVAAPEGLTFPSGSSLRWSFTVTNIGNVALSGIALSATAHGAVACPIGTLAAGQSITCSVTTTAIPGQQSDTASVKAQPPVGPAVSASATVSYVGEPAPEVTTPDTTTPDPVTPVALTIPVIDSPLPATGTDDSGPLLAGLALLGIGGLCSRITRRRRDIGAI